MEVQGRTPFPFINQTNHKGTVWYHCHSVGITRTSPLPCVHVVVSISLSHCPWFEMLYNEIYFDNWCTRCQKVQLDCKCGYNLVCWSSLTWGCRSVAKCLLLLSPFSWIRVSFLNTCFLLSTFPSKVCVYVIVDILPCFLACCNFMSSIFQLLHISKFWITTFCTCLYFLLGSQPC
jgi:hypothetical protein